MGARDRRLGRAISRTLLLLLVAMVAAVSGAVPGGRAEAASKKTPPGDPPGNNGTVKIKQSDPAEDDSLDKSNEPHGTECRIWLAFFDFDQGQRGDIIFTAQPPSGDKDLVVLEDKNVEISGDPAMGGQDQDLVTHAYNLGSEAAAKGLKAHPKQGYHIKLTVIVRNADGSEVPGGTKHKVFWVAPCEAASPSTLRISKALEGSGQGPFTFELLCDHHPLNRTFMLQAGEKLDVAVPPGTTCAVSETEKKGAESTSVTEDPPNGKADDGEVKVTKGTATIVKFKNKFPGTGTTEAPPDTDLRPPAGTPTGGGATSAAGTAGTTGDTGTSAKQPGTAVLGESAIRPETGSALPRTGGDPRPMTATGLCALAAGLALLAGGRQRRA